MSLPAQSPDHIHSAPLSCVWGLWFWILCKTM
uniref:Uncharacterized protein n=1 Tax=Anguilla anguilla TaxID=7936 RepID=A0A0E9S7D4_ANGAN